MVKVTPEMTRKAVLKKLDSFLRERGEDYGIDRLGIFGSVARNEAGDQSDIDLVYIPKSGATLNLLDLALMREELMVVLGRAVDLIEYRRSLPDSLKRRVEKEAVYV